MSEDRADRRYGGTAEALAEAGIDLKAVTRELEAEGVAKFAASYAAVLAGIDAKMGALTSHAGR